MDGNKTFSNAHALIIGVGADLPMTVSDAEGINNILIDPNRAAYAPSNVTLLTESEADRNSILEAFDQLIGKSNEDSTVVVYYSGHGGVDKAKDDEYFLVPHGFQPDDLENTAISGNEFTEKVDAIKSKKLLVFLDCCHAAGFKKEIQKDLPVKKYVENDFFEKSAPIDLLKTLKTGEGKIVVASSRNDESSLAYEGEKYSVFTDYLIKALSGKGTRRPDGHARVFDVLSYLFEQVPLKTNDSQHPFVNEISNLSVNFSISYYAGGNVNSKDLPDSVSTFNIDEFDEFDEFEIELLQIELEQRQGLLKSVTILIGKFETAIVGTEDYEVLKLSNLEQQLMARKRRADELRKEIDEIMTKIRRVVGPKSETDEIQDKIS